MFGLGTSSGEGRNKRSQLKSSMLTGCPLPWTAGSLEHVIELSERGQLTTNGKTPVLEALEREWPPSVLRASACPGRHHNSIPNCAGEESMAVVVPTPRSARWAPVGPEQLEEGAGELPPPAHRLAAQRWAGGVRCRGVHYGYK